MLLGVGGNYDFMTSTIHGRWYQVLTMSGCYFTDKILGTLGEGTFGKVVKVRDAEM